MKKFLATILLLVMNAAFASYNDIYIASADEAKAQLETVEYMLPLIEEYLNKHFKSGSKSL